MDEHGRRAHHWRRRWTTSRWRSRLHRQQANRSPSRHPLVALRLQLAHKKTLLIVQAYAPHSGYDDETIEQFYDDLSEALNQPATHKLVMGDFNAQLGPRTANQRYMGEFSGSTWTGTGEAMADFAESKRLFIVNSFFEKNPAKRWTFESTA